MTQPAHTIPQRLSSYPPLSYPQPLSATASADTCCGPDCVGCCAKPSCCIEPACCSRVGACPCFCTSSTAAFSLSQVGLWCALLLLLLAMSLPDVFTYGQYGLDSPLAGTELRLGMWQACNTDRGGGDYGCVVYGSSPSISDAWYGNGAMFNGMRALTVISATATLIAGVLSAIRLAAQQRGKFVVPALDWSLIVTALLALTSATTAFALSIALLEAFPVDSDDGAPIYVHRFAPKRGGAWAMLTAAWVVLLLAVPLHLIAHFRYQRSLMQRPSKPKEPGVVVMSLYPASPTSFSLPQTHYTAHAQYHTAAVAHSPSTAAHSVMQPSHLYDAEAPPPPLHAHVGVRDDEGEQATAQSGV